MILLIFEGQRDEPRIMSTIARLYLQGGERLVYCPFGTDTYTLWKEVEEYSKDGGEPDVFAIVRGRMSRKGDHSLDSFKSYQFSSIYLFFDYDPQNLKLGVDKLNVAVSSTIETFSDPTGNGQVFISYPMVEALYYNAESVLLSECRSFKRLSLSSLPHFAKSPLLLKTDANFRVVDTPSESRLRALQVNWERVVLANIMKANYICNKKRALPESIEDVSQKLIFEHQKTDYVSNGEVAILSGFPAFLYEYKKGADDFLKPSSLK